MRGCHRFLGKGISRMNDISVKGLTHHYITLVRIHWGFGRQRDKKNQYHRKRMKKNLAKHNSVPKTTYVVGKSTIVPCDGQIQKTKEKRKSDHSTRWFCSEWLAEEFNEYAYNESNTGPIDLFQSFSHSFQIQTPFANTELFQLANRIIMESFPPSPTTHSLPHPLTKSISLPTSSDITVFFLLFNLLCIYSGEQWLV